MKSESKTKPKNNSSMDDLEKFYKAAFRFLSFRPRSEKEVKRLLKKKKCDELTSQRIIENLKEHKFLNDEEFARWWIEQRTFIKPKAWRVIKFELKQKGIAEEIIAEIRKDENSNRLGKGNKIGAKKK